MATEKMYCGNPPISGDWHMVGRCKADETEWLVFRKAQAHSQEWADYKITALGRAKRKANYWLVRNDKTGQIGFARDFAIMRANRQELHEQVERIFSDITAKQEATAP